MLASSHPPCLTPFLSSSLLCVSSLQITARAEAGHEQVCIRFEVSPPDAAVSKYMVLCTTASGKAIKSKKVQSFKKKWEPQSRKA